MNVVNVGKPLYLWAIVGVWWRLLNGRTTLGQHQQWLCYIEIGKWYFLFCWRSNKALILSQHQGLHWKNVCISLVEQLRAEVGPKLAFANRKKVYFLHWLDHFGPMLDLHDFFKVHNQELNWNNMQLTREENFVFLQN